MHLVVEGPIGVGKTTLTHLLAREFAARLNLEVVEENPFLAPFYEDRERYAFSVQVFFLLSRFKQLTPFAQANLFEPVVSDYMFDKDFIFAQLNLREAEFELYQDLYTALRPRLPIPDLVIYLRGDLELLLSRIAKRGRVFEAAIDPEYLRELNRYYENFFRTYEQTTGGRLLILEAAELDIVDNDKDRQWVIESVRAELRAEPGIELSTEPNTTVLR